MDRIELADGGWIDLRDPEDLSEGHRQDIILAVNETEKTSTLRQDFAMTNSIAAALITQWNIPYLAPPDEVGPNPMRQLKPVDARLLDPHLRATFQILFPLPATVDDYEDPSSPTEPAND
jgi:hypothetical protein